MKKLVSIIIAGVLLVSAMTISVSASTVDDDLVKELNKQISACEGRKSLVGSLKPYTESSFNRENIAYNYAKQVVSNPNSTNDDYKTACELFDYALDNIYVDSSYASATYVIALNENNESGFYDETDWNDFTKKRDELREAIKAGDEKTINDAYVAILKSYNNMIDKYTIAGDVNNDGVFSVDDVTLVQKYLNNSVEFTETQKYLAFCYNQNLIDYNEHVATIYCDVIPEITIDNVTVAQKALSKMCSEFEKPVLFGNRYTDLYGVETNDAICIGSADPRTPKVYGEIRRLEAEGTL